MESFELEIGQRHENRQTGHAIKEELPEAGVRVDDDQVAESRQTHVQDRDLSSRQADTKGQAAQTEPGQQFLPRRGSDGIEDQYKTGGRDDDELRKDDEQVSTVRGHGR